MKNYLEARREELRKRGDKGFTLMEMLIVVAIIAVLIAIAIPVFTDQLERSREATDAANIRSAYAEVAAEALTDPEKVQPTTVTKVQQIDGWENTALEDIAGIAIGSIESAGETTIDYDPETGEITIDDQVAQTSFIDGD